MLYIVTKPPEFVPGVFTCSELSQSSASSLLKEHYASQDYQPFIFHGSTKRALMELSDLSFSMAPKKQPIPAPRTGDVFLYVTLGERETSGPPKLDDHLFFQISYSKTTS